jgi:hypothetical protein
MLYSNAPTNGVSIPAKARLLMLPVVVLVIALHWLNGDVARAQAAPV